MDLNLLKDDNRIIEPDPDSKHCASLHNLITESLPDRAGGLEVGSVRFAARRICHEEDDAQDGQRPHHRGDT